MQRTSRAAAVFTALLLAVAIASASAQQPLLTIDDLYDPQKRVFRAPEQPSAVKWLDDSKYVAPRPVEGTDGRFTLVRVDAATGAEAPLFDPAALETALVRLPGIARAEAADLARQRSYPMNAAGTGLLVTIADDLYFWTLGADRATRITRVPGKEEEATFSPDGRLLAYVRENNLYVADLDGREHTLTTDGHAQLLNGKLDWVYQEEVYGRGTFRAFEWSPDSTRLAYLQLDERPVHEFTVIDHIGYRQEVEVTDYPKPGDPNPVVKLGVVGVAGGATTWMDATKYAAGEHLVVRFGWTPDGSRVVYQVQDREQTWLDLNTADSATGAPTTISRETTKAWVSVLGEPVWLKDGGFLWMSERSGYQHLYRYTREGKILKQLTDGPWDVETLHGVDETGRLAYFSGTERSPIGLDVYRVSLDGGEPQRVSAAPGTHKVTFNRACTMYVDSWSDLTTPTQVRVHRSDGTAVRVVDENPMPALAKFRLSQPELLQVPTRDGFLMEAMLIRPPDFDPSRKYPVFQPTYAGPSAPQVRNAWGGSSYLFLQLLAQRGIVVWVCDNRSASGKGAVSKWPVYQRLGELELQDIEDGLAYLKKQPWVDASRIGISGWSYGGFMASYALTHSTSFAMGIAGGSVTDWRGYDSIYTERYMRLPQNNPDGYARTAPSRAAANLSGRLLLLHGLMDDNVHVQNTIQFAYELQRAGKPFEMMLYPKSRHGVTDPLLVKHMRQLMLDFTLRTLTPDGRVETRRDTAAARPGTGSR